MDNEGCNTHLRLVLVGNHVVTFQNDMFRRKDVGSKIIIDCLNHQKAKITVQVQGDEDQSTDTEVAHEESFTNVNDFISQEPGIPFRDVESPPRMDVPNDEIPTFNVTTHHEETQNSNLNDHSGGQQHNQGNSGEHHRNLHNEEGDMNAHMRRPRAQPGRSAKVRAQASLKDLAKNSKGSKTSRRSRIRTTLVRKNNVTPSRQPANDVGPSEFTPFSGRSHTQRDCQ
ncbi:unnamed protein product [Cuscuta campestris]|uniref:Uncharacterized protein n=1 Tax=Cuscuta campestris TaxID=132261 RepID=A0A484N590_9ASTE|nr:unnamed protein product [Cuscuta campestris]